MAACSRVMALGGGEGGGGGAGGKPKRPGLAHLRIGGVGKGSVSGGGDGLSTHGLVQPYRQGGKLKAADGRLQQRNLHQEELP